MADCDIGLAAHEVADRVGGENFNINARRQVAELEQNLRQLKRRHRLAGADADRPFNDLRLAGGGQRHAGCGRPHGAHLINQLQPAWREDEAAPRALNQRDTQFPLESRDLSAQRGLGHAQSPRRR